MPHLIATVHIICIVESKSWGRYHLFIGTNIINQGRVLHCAFFELWGFTCVLHELHDTYTTNIFLVTIK